MVLFWSKLFLMSVCAASVWPAIQLPVCVVWPKTKLNCSGNATQSYSRWVMADHTPSLFLPRLLLSSCERLSLLAHASPWALHPTSNRSCCWRRSKQISGRKPETTAGCGDKHFFVPTLKSKFIWLSYLFVLSSWRQ